MNDVAKGWGSAFVATAIFFGLWILQSNAYFGPAATWSTMSRFALTQSVVENHALTIDARFDSTGDRSFNTQTGHWYSDKAPVPAFFGILGYRIVRSIQWLQDRPAPTYQAEARGDIPAVRVVLSQTAQQLLYASSVSAAGLCGALAAVILLIMLSRRFSPEVALFASVCVVLCTPWFSYATSFYGHVPAGFFLIAALAMLDGAHSRARLAMCGACLTLAVGCELLTALPGAVIGGWVLRRGRRDGIWLRDGAWLVAGALPVIVLLGAYNQHCFGSPWKTGYSHLVNREFVAGHARGLMGISIPTPSGLWGTTFGGQRGLFYIAPVCLAGVIGLVQYLRAQKDELARVYAVAALLLFLANAGYYMWWGGASTGPRHLVPVLPVLGWGIASLLQHAKWRWWVAVLAVISAANVLAFTAVGLEAPENRETLFGYAWQGLLNGRIAHLSAASNIGLQLGLPGSMSLMPLILWWIFGIRYLLGGLAKEPVTV